MGTLQKLDVYLQCVMYKSCTPQICHKASCTVVTTVNGANAQTNATIQTSHPALSPVFGETNALCDSESLLQGVAPSEYHSEWMLTAVGGA